MLKKTPRIKKRQENSNNERLHLKKKIGLFPSDPAPITNILSSFIDLKVHGSCQINNFTASTPSYMFKEVVLHMQ